MNSKKHRRKYIPVIPKKIEKEVWINYFCNNADISYLESVFMIIGDTEIVC